MADESPASDRKGGSKSAVAIIATIIILGVIGFLVWLLGWSGIVNSNGIYGSTNGSTNSTKSNQPTKAEQQAKVAKIKDNWQTFFNGQTPTGQRVGLLQNGQQYAAVVDKLSQTKMAQATTVTVTNVDLKGNTATVTYTINVNKKPELKNRTGEAVLVDNTWKVSDEAFCGLMQLYGNVPPNCPKVGGSTNQTQQNATQPSNQPTQPNATKAQ